ncbi:TPA: hypothetical protein HA316_05625 [Candidatus Micrarchaeota archaeon]|nr:hypothetical protein [Candidatus Micrarchaeota archaeon]
MARVGFMRAQASMEYLMTYSWAFIALFVVIALLVSTSAMGAFRPQETCVFTPDFPCYSYVSYIQSAAPHNAVVTVNLTNGFGYDINIGPDITLTRADGQPIGTPTVEPILPKIVSANSRQGIRIVYEDANLRAGDTNEVLITINYANCAPQVLNGIDCAVITSYPHKITGKVVAIVVG